MLWLLVTSFCGLHKREHSELRDSMSVILITRNPALLHYPAGFGVNNPELTDRASSKPQTLVSQHAREKQRFKMEKLEDTGSKGEKESNK